MDVRGTKVSLRNGRVSYSVLIPSGTDYADLLWCDDALGGVAVYGGSEFVNFQGQAAFPCRIDWQVLGGSGGACPCAQPTPQQFYQAPLAEYLWDPTPAAMGSTFLAANLQREGLLFQCGMAGAGSWLLRGRNNSGAVLKITLTAAPLGGNCCCSLTTMAGSMIG